MKHDTYEKYLACDIDLAQRALLTTWDCLGAYQADLALVGGLAIKFLTKPPTDGMPGPVTLDVDFGISIGAESGMYGTIRETLSAHGFNWSNNRFVRKFREMDLYLDLLTDHEDIGKNTVTVDDGLAVSVIPGISRALEKSRLITVSGMNLLGTKQTEQIRVAEVGPMLVLKLNAFGAPTGPGGAGGRKAPKDLHYVLYLAMNYIDGLGKAVAGFHDEKSAGNRGISNAIHTLNSYFSGPEALGPISCAAFRLSGRHLEADFKDESERIRQQCVTLAEMLLG